MDFNALLALMVQKNSFDLFITAGRAPTMKIDGTLVEISKTTLSKEQTLALVLSLMEPRHKEEFHKTKECQFAIGVPKVGRFRVSAFIQRDAAGMVLHRIRLDIPDIDTLNLPEILKQLVMQKRGLILFAGTLGSGKSTAIAALTKYRNQNSNGHIIILEDPMKFMHSHAGCIVTQREVGIDTASYEAAFKNILQQSPNVVSIGEIRSREAVKSAITIIESGCLCLSSTPANNAEQTVERILNFFPDDMHKQVSADLAANLLAIVSLRIIRFSDGESHAVTEILMNTPPVQDVIRRGDFQRFKEFIIKGRSSGMQSYDQSLCDLFLQQKITYDDALDAAEYKNEFRSMVKQLMQEMELNTMNVATEDQNVPGIAPKSASETKRTSLLDAEITLSDVYDGNTDSGSIFTHRK